MCLRHFLDAYYRTKFVTVILIKLKHFLIKGKNAADELGATEYLECSALTGDGVERVFEQAIRVAIAHKNTTQKKQRRKWLCNLS